MQVAMDNLQKYQNQYNPLNYVLFYIEMRN